MHSIPSDPTQTSLSTNSSSPTKTETFTITPGTTSPLFLQEVIQNGLRSSTDTVLKSENEAHGADLDQLYGEEPRHFTD